MNHAYSQMSLCRLAPRTYEAMGRILASPSAYAGDPSQLNLARILRELDNDGWVIRPPGPITDTSADWEHPTPV